MTVWATRPVEEVAEVELDDWSVRELQNGDRHFVGWNRTELEGRVSSLIVKFDSRSMIGTTKSGRRYKLVGPPHHNSDAEYVWNTWSRVNSVESWQEVSDEYVEAFLKQLWIAQGRDPSLFPTLGTIDKEDMEWAIDAAYKIGWLHTNEIAAEIVEVKK